ncbi:hypothetical protein BDV06DRAFT_132149 [Aspergillus oleicola]
MRRAAGRGSCLLLGGGKAEASMRGDYTLHPINTISNPQYYLKVFRWADKPTTAYRSPGSKSSSRAWIILSNSFLSRSTSPLPCPRKHMYSTLNPSASKRLSDAESNVDVLETT